MRCLPVRSHQHGACRDARTAEKDREVVGFRQYDRNESAKRKAASEFSGAPRKMVSTSYEGDRKVGKDYREDLFREA